jgi:hypothetical protein
MEVSSEIHALANLRTEVRTPISVRHKTVWGHRASADALEERKIFLYWISEENETGIQT